MRKIIRSHLRRVQLKVQGKDRERNELKPTNPKYQRHVGVAELQTFCLDDYKKRIFYPKKIYLQKTKN